jgi:hypothetical protein
MISTLFWLFDFFKSSFFNPNRRHADSHVKSSRSSRSILLRVMMSMADGIYAEECLYYLDGSWQARPWTYPDYRRADFQAFFGEARELLIRAKGNDS